MHYLSILLIAIALVLQPGCSSTQKASGTPDGLYQQAEQDIKDDHYELALEKLRILKNKFPYSKFSVLATLRMGDVYFLQESFAEAAATYQVFTELHPKHEKVEYARFRMGESHYQEIPGTVARDLEAANASLTAFQSYLRDFPKGKERPNAVKREKEVRSVLAEKEFYIGEYYYKRDYYHSAKGRYEKLIRKYPDTEWAKKAQEHLAEIKKNPGDSENENVRP